MYDGEDCGRRIAGFHVKVKMACFNNAMVGNKSLDCIIMSLVTCCNQRLTVCLLPGFRCVWGCAPCEDSL